MFDPVPIKYQTLSIPNLRQALLEPIRQKGSQFRGWVMEDLSIDPNSRLSPWKDGTRWIDVSDRAGFKAKLRISSSVWAKAIENGYQIGEGIAIDLVINALNLDKWLQIEIDALAVRAAGQGKLEALREKIFVYCNQKGYFRRPKKPMPVIICKVAIISTTGSTIESDIQNQIGIRPDFISDYRFNGTATELKAMIEKIARGGEHDIIALYRGGREDEYMFTFSDPMVLDAVVHSPIPVVTAIGHECDTPPVQMIADMGFASPTKFATFVKKRNEDALSQADLCLRKIHQHFRNYLTAVEKDLLLLIGTINAIGSDLVRLHTAREHKRNMAFVIFMAVLIIAGVIAFFMFRK